MPYINIFYTSASELMFVHGDIHTTKKQADKEASSYKGRTALLPIDSSLIIRRPLSWEKPRKLVKIK